ncbi:MAG TPA: FtsX-like permease family protein [Thermodesulfovibrionales bacterium]|nr:FtsX-like permease family protein [Thermodesulfovibrionales bacterium]
MKLLRLLRMLVLRNIREEKFLTFLSVLGISLGIGLFTGVKVASDRAVASFESDIKGANPHANYEVLDISGVDFKEQVYSNVRAIEDRCLPFLRTYGYIPSLKEGVDIRGIYVLKAGPFLNSPLSEGGDLEHFYRELNSVLVTKNFAVRHSIKKGDTLNAIIYDKQYPIKVAGILDSKSILTNAMIMDLGNFQEYFGQTGYLSGIELMLDENTEEAISKTLPSNLRVERKELIFRNQKALVSSFRYNLQFVSLIAILVGVFLLYNTVFISVVKRRTEIGILRGLGAGKKTIMFIFTAQGLFLGVIGSLIGIVFGQFAAYLSVKAVEKTILTMYSSISISDYMLSWQDVLTALLLGILVSLCASLIPSFEASKIRPNESSREGSFEGRYRRYHKWLSLAGLFLVVAGIGIACFDYLYSPFSFPFLAYSGVLLLIAGFTFISPFYLSVVLKGMGWPAGKLFRAIGRITLGDMKGNIYRYSVALMSVAISSALIVALLTLIFSFRNSLKGWINKNITADVYIKPASCKANYCFFPLSADVIEKVKDLPEVAGVDRFRGMQLELHGKKVIAGFADIQVKGKYLHKRYRDKAYENTLKEMEGDERVAGISDYLSIKYGLKKGDTIELHSPAGDVKFRINDIFSSYSTTAGFIYIDRKWLKKYWGMDDATQISVYLKDGVNADDFIHNLRSALSSDYSLEIMNNQELRDKIMGIFNKTFAITYAIELISIIVSLIGVMNTLLALVFERKREISIIRYIGGTWRQIRQTLLLSAGIIGLTGIVLGSILGPIMSLIMIYVVNKISFGWEIHFQLPALYLSVVSFMLFLTVLLAGLLPSAVARRIDPKRFASFE